MGSVGYFYRKNDVSIFPKIGTTFLPQDIITSDVFSSCALIYKQFKIEPSFHYELFSSDMNKKGENQVYYAQNIIRYGFNNGGLFFLTKYGKSRWYEYLKNETSGLQILDTLDLGIGIDLFLFDTGLFRGNTKGVATHHYVPVSGFNSYDIRIDIPVTMSLYYADIGIMYTGYYTGIFDIYREKSNRDYVIEKPYSYITGRYGFDANKPRYKLINSLEIENRWYFLRGISHTSSVFAAIVGSIGLGIDRTDAPSFFGQLGLGIGYMLFDSVPFTFQVGFDNDRNIVIYTGVVSRISHF
jgi:hypothetical protein